MHYPIAIEHTQDEDKPRISPRNWPRRNDIFRSFHARIAAAPFVLSLLLSGCSAPSLATPAAQILEQTTSQSQSTTQSQSFTQSQSITQSQPLSDTAAVLTPEQQLLASLPNRGAAPELFNETWLNSPPLKLAELRGKVVLIKFWTFG
jgi:hypothetical protein